MGSVPSSASTKDGREPAARTNSKPTLTSNLDEPRNLDLQDEPAAGKKRTVRAVLGFETENQAYRNEAKDLKLTAQRYPENDRRSVPARPVDAEVDQT